MFSNEPLVITSTIYLFLSQLTCSWKVRHFLFIGNDHKETSPVSMQSILLVFQSFQSINHQQPHVQFKGTAHATLDKFENGVFTLKTHQTGFPSTPRRRNLKNNHRLLRICVWEKLGQGDHVLVVMSSFSKSSVFKMFSVHTKRKAGVFKFLLFEERFRNVPFPWRISVDGRPNRRHKAAISNFSGVVWATSSCRGSVCCIPAWSWCFSVLSHVLQVVATCCTKLNSLALRAT